MSTRTNARPTTVIKAASMAAATITSSPTILQSLSMVSYSVVWTGSSPIGTLSVQASNDVQIGIDGTVVAGTGTWNTLYFNYNGSLVSSIPVSGNSGNGLINLSNLSFYAIQLVYTKTSGTGSLTATVTGKVQ